MPKRLHRHSSHLLLLAQLGTTPNGKRNLSLSTRLEENSCGKFLIYNILQQHPMCILKVRSHQSGWRHRKGQLTKYSLLGEPLFNQQDLLALEDIESFSQNFGLNTDWYLPTEPSITQIFAGEPAITSLPTPSSPYQSQRQDSQSNQSLSKLPVEREAVGKSPNFRINIQWNQI